jgi:RNA polymerase sigma factor for flagellar operon FliA
MGHCLERPAPTNEEVRTYLPLVERAVRRLAYRMPRSVQRDDLVATATFGLFDALRRSPDRGPAFTYYARLRIEGALKDWLRAQDPLRRRDRRRKWTPPLVTVAFDDLDESVLLQIDPDSRTPEDELELKARHAALGQAMRLLPGREARILRLHYFEGMPMEAIGRLLGVSESRVYQLHRAAASFLRKRMTAPTGARLAA